MSATCWFFHCWSKWKVVKQGPVINRYDTEIGHYVEQTRTCDRCGKVQMRMEQSLA